MLIQEYNKNWAVQFRTLSQLIREALYPLSIAIEHIGSTAVPGLAAKPIIDMDLVYETGTAFEEIKIGLERTGYFHNGNQGIPGREVFKRNKTAPAHKALDSIAHHLYVCPADSEELKKHLLFREYLKANEAARTQYQNLKYRVAAAAGQNRKKYAELKEQQAQAFISGILDKAGAAEK